LRRDRPRAEALFAVALFFVLKPVVSSLKPSPGFFAASRRVRLDGSLGDKADRAQVERAALQIGIVRGGENEHGQPRPPGSVRTCLRTSIPLISPKKISNSIRSGISRSSSRAPADHSRRTRNGDNPHAEKLLDDFDVERSSSTRRIWALDCGESPASRAIRTRAREFQRRSARQRITGSGESDFIGIGSMKWGVAATSS